MVLWLVLHERNLIQPDYSGSNSSRVLSQDVHSLFEDFDAKRKPGDNESSVVEEEAGRREGGAILGRYPFLACVNKYLAATGSAYAELTLKDLRRRYRRMEKDLKMLVESGMVKTSNPEKMRAEDVLAYVGFQRKKGMKPSAISHNITVLNSLLLFVGNSAVQQCRVKYRNLMPKQKNPRLPPLDEGQFRRIMMRAGNVEESDWTMMKAFAIVVLSICAGLRCKELRLSRVSDIDVATGVMHVEHVKGEDTYGEPREAIIMPVGRDFLRKYLRVRNALVAKKCPSNQALFPALRDDEDGYFSTNHIEKLKRLVVAETGIDFDLRMCRRTFGQIFMDGGLRHDSVSVMMGHASTRTTEEYYCRKRTDMAIKEAQALFMSKNGEPDAKNLKIEKFGGLTGYA